MEQVVKELMKFSLSENEAEDIVEILHNQKNIPLEKCVQYWDKLCFKFDNFEDIDIDNTDFNNMQELLNNKDFRENTYILRSGKLVSIG